MKNLKIAILLGFVLMFVFACTKEDIQPDPLSASDDYALKSAKAQKSQCGEQHFRPFKASFELTAYFDHFGFLDQKDFQTNWPAIVPRGGMHVKITGSGKATHMGKTDLEIDQWWTRNHPDPPPVVSGFFSYGQGTITFTAANGDKLFGTYWGWADHQDDPPTEIETYGIFTGGTGRFEGATGTYLWEGLFIGKFKPNPDDPPDAGTEFGTGNVKVTGEICY